MTHPEQFTPREAANYGSLSAWSQTTEEEWREQQRGKTSQHLQTTKTGFNKIGSDIGTILSNIVGSVFGDGNYSSNGHGFARNALDSMNSLLLNNTRAIQDMQARDNGDVAQGKVISLDFDDYPDGSMPSIFTLTYLPPPVGAEGSSTLGITDGKAGWRTQVANGGRDCLVRYNVAPTDTSFQILRGTMSSPPQDETSTGKPYFYACARMNADGSDYVWARAWSVGGFFLYRLDMGCVKDGVEYVWVDGDPDEDDVLLTWSFDLSFVCGVGANLRQHQVFSGNRLVYTYTEDSGQPGGLSEESEDHRYWGSKATIRLDNNGKLYHGGTLAGAAVADNQIPPVLGSRATMYRTNTAVEGFTGGSTITSLDNFFEFVRHASSDILTDTGDGTMTVSREGTYIISARIELNSSQSSRCWLVLKVNGAVADWSQGLYPDHNEALQMTWTQYLDAGDIVQLCTMHNGITLNNLTGDATGTRTYFKMVRVPDPEPVPPAEEA